MIDPHLPLEAALNMILGGVATKVGHHITDSSLKYAKSLGDRREKNLPRPGLLTEEAKNQFSDLLKRDRAALEEFKTLTNNEGIENFLDAVKADNGESNTEVDSRYRNLIRFLHQNSEVIAGSKVYIQPIRSSPKVQRVVSLTSKIDRNEVLQGVVDSLRSYADRQVSRPIFIAVSGYAPQGFDPLLARIKEKIEKELKQNKEIPFKDSNIMWKAYDCRVEEALVHYEKSLLSSGLKDNPETSISNLNRQMPNPYLLHTRIDISKGIWKSHQKELIDRLYRFWETWPDLRRKQLLIVCIFFSQKMPKEGMIGRFQSRITEFRFKLLQKKLESKPKDSDRLIFRAIEPLPLIGLDHVDNWIDNNLKQELKLEPIDKENIFSHIRESYESKGKKEMTWEEFREMVMKQEFLDCFVEST